MSKVIIIASHRHRWWGKKEGKSSVGRELLVSAVIVGVLNIMEEGGQEQFMVGSGGGGEQSVPKTESTASDGSTTDVQPLTCAMNGKHDNVDTTPAPPYITPTKRRILPGTCNTPSGSSFTSSLPIMREQDADLLESMHYAASQVSQYSPGGTPILRPTDRSLPMEDLNLTLTPMVASLELLVRTHEDDRNNNYGGRLGIETAASAIDQKDSDDWEDAGGRNVDGSDAAKCISRTSLRTDFSSDGRNLFSRESSGSAIFRSVTFSTKVDAQNDDLQQQQQHHEQQLTSQTTTTCISGLTSASSTNSESGGDASFNALRGCGLSGSSINQVSTILVDQPSPQVRRPSFRRLLSGEVRTIHMSEDGRSVEDAETSMREEDKSHKETEQRNDHSQHEAHITMAGEEMIDGKPASTTVTEQEEDTTGSPLSVLQEAEKAKAKEESGMAERRRVNEAIQFAQAVGEEISINRNDLRIIEDNEEEDDDDDDDEAIEATEVVALPISGLHQYEDGSPPHLGPEALDSRSTANNTNHVSLADAGGDTCDTSLPISVDVRQTPSHGHHHRRKSRPAWPFEQPAESENAFMEHLSDGADRTNFVYHGIQSNPPEITYRGIQRGNYAQLHRKAWLEVSDKYHRYGKNLRLYYRYWERLGFPTNKFFDWLDSKGEAAGQPLPHLDECPRSVLDSDTVLYITNPKVTDGYALDIESSIDEGHGRVVDVDGDAVITGPDGWIFVLRDNVMYGAPKITSISGHSKQRFHHSSFFGGKAVASAGIIITDEEGYLTRLYPHSGHYRPSESHMQRMLLFLHRKGVDLRTLEVDTQQLSRLSREKETKPRDKKSKSGTKDEVDAASSGKKEKTKKVDSLHLEKAIDVACYLAHKADFIGKGIFDQIHQIRKADVTSVTEALNLVDNGGYWKIKKACQHLVLL